MYVIVAKSIYILYKLLLWTDSSKVKYLGTVYLLIWNSFFFLYQTVISPQNYLYTKFQNNYDQYLHCKTKNK